MLTSLARGVDGSLHPDAMIEDAIAGKRVDGTKRSSSGADSRGREPGSRRFDEQSRARLLSSQSYINQKREALRLIDHKHVIRSDFILISGDVVSNVDLTPYIAAHQERHKQRS